MKNTSFLRAILLLIIVVFLIYCCENKVNINQLNFRATEFLELGDTLKAVKIYKKILQKDPNNAQAYFDLGNINLSITHYNK